MSCWETIQDYALRSIGIGERLLPRDTYSLCEQFTLIGSGMIWNIYFGTLALLVGFFIATAVALRCEKPRNGSFSSFVDRPCSCSFSLPISVSSISNRSGW